MLLVLAGLLCLFTLGTNLKPSVASANSNECSDVFTPLSSFVASGVSNNKGWYVQAMNETGVPWEMLAAIHYRETNFSHTNPSNGQGIFQFVNGDGGPYPTGPVSDAEFYRQLKFMANRLQNDYAYRNSPNPAPVVARKLIPNEQDINLIKNTLYSYNGRSSQYANQGSNYGFNPSSQPYEGSPYVMNRFDCQRARMGMITRDYGTIDGVDARYGTFTLFARLRGESYWHALTQQYAWSLSSQELYSDTGRSNPANSHLLSENTLYYVRMKVRNIGSSSWSNSGYNPVTVGTANSFNRNSIFCDSSWITCNRAAALKESSVAPGEVGTFEFSIKTPNSYGVYNEYFNLVAENKAWMVDIGMHLSLKVSPPSGEWVMSEQKIFSDSSRSKALTNYIVAPNTTYYMQVKAQNTGNTTWKNSGSNPVYLGTSGPLNRNSIFCDSSWITCNRAATLKESSVAPGEVGTFEFSIKTPNSYGVYNEYFNLVAENKAWMRDIGMHLPIDIKTPVSLWLHRGQNVYADSSTNTPLSLSGLTNNSRSFVIVKAQNTGNTTWKNSGSNPVYLGTSGPLNRNSIFCDSSWITCNRAATLKESSVAPGEVGTFEFWIKAPYALDGAVFKEYFTPLVENTTWMNDMGMHLSIAMNTPVSSWQYVSQSAHSNSARTSAANLSSTTTSSTYYLTLKARNSSGSTWKNSGSNPVYLGTSGPLNRNSIFCDSSWITCNRAATLKESSVAPGEVGTFEFSIKTPNSYGVYNEYFQPVIEGKSWLIDYGLHWQINTNR